jgi:hypothetical protein
MRLLVFVLAACAIPQFEDLGAVNDAGSCSVIVLPGDCGDVGELQRRFEAELPCNVCISYRCACERHTFCKVCVGGVDPVHGWGCTPNARAFCTTPD